MVTPSGDDLLIIEGYLDELRLVYGRAANTVDSYYLDLCKAAGMLAEGGVGLLAASQDDIATLMGTLRGQMAESSLARMMSALRNLYRWLVEVGNLPASPLDHLEIPRVPYRLPEIVTVEEVSRLVEVIDTSTPLGLRDRAILELLYGSGLRVSEAIGLDVEDFIEGDRLLRVTGKGDKTRIVPLTPYTEEYLQRYITGGARQRALGSKRNSAIFISSRGTRLTRQAVWQFTRRYALAAQITVAIHPHTLRHSCATHMVNAGADIRVVQELLGHASLATTQIYTQVTPARLAKVYRNTHPRAEIGRETFL